MSAAEARGPPPARPRLRVLDGLRRVAAREPAASTSPRAATTSGGPALDGVSWAFGRIAEDGWTSASHLSWVISAVHLCRRERCSEARVPGSPTPAYWASVAWRGLLIVRGRAGINLDVKTTLEDADATGEAGRPRLYWPLWSDCAEAGRRPVLVSSFDPAALLVVGEHAAGIRRALLGVGRTSRCARWSPPRRTWGWRSWPRTGGRSRPTRVDRAPAFRSVE